MSSDYDSYPDATIWIPSPAPFSPIPAIFIPYRDADALLIFAHGNGCDIGGMYETMHYYHNHWRVNVLLFEYPGYGACLGVPSEESINSNLKRVFEFVRDALHWPTDRLILYGQSIGTGPVCQLAMELNESGVHLGGVILQSPYTCLRDVAQFLAGTLASKLIKTSFNNLECVKKIVDPIMIMHGVKDTIIPLGHSDQLYEASVSERKHLLVVNSAGHNEWDHHHDIIAPIAQFLQVYLRTPARIPDAAALAAAEKASALAQAAAAESFKASAASSSSSSASPPPPSTAKLSYFVHHPPSSPMPPATLKIEKKYFTVPSEVIQAHIKRVEDQRRAAESRARNAERGRAVKGFFVGLGAKLTSGVSAIVNSTRAESKSDASSERESPAPAGSPAGVSQSAPPPKLAPRPASATSRGSSASSQSRESSSGLPPPSPQRAHSPAGRSGDTPSRTRDEDDPMQSPMQSPVHSPNSSGSNFAITNAKPTEEDDDTADM